MPLSCCGSLVDWEGLVKAVMRHLNLPRGLVAPAVRLVARFVVMRTLQTRPWWVDEVSQGLGVVKGELVLLLLG